MNILIISARNGTHLGFSGRDNLLRNAISAISAFSHVKFFKINSLLTPPIGIIHSIASLSAFLLSWLRGRPLPLQTALYLGDIAQFRRTLDSETFDYAFVDGARLLPYARVLADRGIPVVYDLDDLLSRRIGALSRLGYRPSRGKLGANIPQVLYDALTLGGVGKQILKLERALCLSAEIDAVRCASSVVVTSPYEARLLKRMASKSGVSGLFAPHPFSFIFSQNRAEGARRRLIFIGSEALPQNADGILWCERIAPSLHGTLEIHLFGTTGEGASSASNLVSHGFTEDLSEIYTAKSVATCMTRVRGGLKTKIFEAWSYGIPVLVTREAFEGIAAPDYPLILPWSCDVDEILNLLDEQTLHRAVEIGRSYILKHYSNPVERWRRIFETAGSGPSPHA